VTLTKKVGRSAPDTEENGDQQARIGSKRKRDLGEAGHKAKKKKTDTGGAVVKENPSSNVKVVGAKDKEASRKGSIGKTQSRATEVPGASKVAEKSHLAAESSSGSSSSSDSEADLPSAKTGKGLGSNVEHQAQSKTAPKINATPRSKTTSSKVPQPTADSSSSGSSSDSSSDSSDSTESKKPKQPAVEKAALSNAVRFRPTAGSSSDSSSSEEDSSCDDDAKVVKALPSTSASVKKKPVVDSSDDSSSSSSDDSSSDDDTAAARKTSEKAPAAASRNSVSVIPTKEPVAVRPEQTVSGKPKRKRKRKNKNKNKLPPGQSQPIPAPPALRTAAEFPPAGAGKRKVFNDEEEEESSSEEESSEEQAEGGGSDFTAEEIRSLYSLSKPAAAVAPVSSIGPQLPKVCRLLSFKQLNRSCKPIFGTK
jgi:hypothetical protein